MCHAHGPGEPEPLSEVGRSDVEIDVDAGEKLPARVCRPRGGVWGSVVIATDIYGANRFYKGIAERLAAEGCAAILPDIFFREGDLPEVTREAAFERRARLDDARALRDLTSAQDWLVRETGAPGAVLGFCLGGNLGFHLAAVLGAPVTVTYYGFPAGLPAPKGLAPPLEITTKLRGPILGFWGGKDEKVGMDNVAAFRAAAESAALDYEQHVYPEVEHGFLAGLDEGRESPNHAPAADSWKRTLAFLRRHLGEQSASV